MSGRTLFQLVICVASAALLASCATTQQSLAHTRAGFDDVWKAALAAVIAINYSVSSADAAAGFIVAEQAVVAGGGSVARLNIQIQRTGTLNEVKVSFVPPPGTIGGRGVADNYIKALKARVPDLEVRGI
jgi:hypothetical protein